MRYAQRINRIRGWKGHLWQWRFFSSALHRDQRTGALGIKIGWAFAGALLVGGTLFAAFVTQHGPSLSPSPETVDANDAVAPRVVQTVEASGRGSADPERVPGGLSPDATAEFEQPALL